MAQDHAKQQMVERALVNELESDDKLKLQKFGRTCVTKKRRARIKLPKLNTALVEVYQELGKATHAVKDMAVSSKLAHKQAKMATELWQASENHLTELEQRLRITGDSTSLALPPPYPTFSRCRPKQTQPIPPSGWICPSRSTTPPTRYQLTTKPAITKRRSRPKRQLWTKPRNDMKRLK